MPHDSAPTTDLGQRLLTHKPTQIGEIVFIFAVALGTVLAGKPFAGDNPFAFMVVVAFANLLILAMVWWGLRLRRQPWAHFGLATRFSGWKTAAWTFLKSIAVCVAGVSAFVFGAILMGMILGRPEQADLSDYNFLQGNLPLLLLSMVSVYVTASFGEEVFYRGFLITRIEELGDGKKPALYFAVVFSSIVFGAAHSGWGLAGMVQATSMGFALALSYLIAGRRLWINILAHAYMDTALIVPLYFAQSG